MNIETKAKLVANAAKGLLTAGGALAIPVFSQPADAALIGTLGGGTGTFYSISAAGIDNGAFAGLNGGSVYSTDQGFAHPPGGGLFGGHYLAAGTQAGQPAILTFNGAINYFSFLWGSPDTTNTLEVVTFTAAIYDFTLNSLNFTVTNGSVDFSQYVQFFANAPGETIVSALFSNDEAQNSFEVANFSGVLPRGGAVPEPASWAMMLLGFGGLGAVLRRRRRHTALLAALFVGIAAPALALPPPLPGGTNEADIGMAAGDLTHSFTTFNQNNFVAGDYSHSLTVGTGSATASLSALNTPTPHLDALASVTSGPAGSFGFGNAGAQGFTNYSFLVLGVGDAPVTINASGSAGFSSLQTGGHGNAELLLRIREGDNNLSGPLVLDEFLNLNEVGGVCSTSCADSFAVDSDFLLHTNTIYTVHMDVNAGLFGGGPPGTNTAYANIDPMFTVHGPFTIQLSDGFGGGINLPGAGGGVPEPASWALMLLGFGGLGAALRRRRAGPSAGLAS